MNTRVTVGTDGEAITVHIPLTFRKRGGRKRVVTPDGAEWAPRPGVDNAIVKALAWAFRWRKMPDTDVHTTIEDLAKANGPESWRVAREGGVKAPVSRFPGSECGPCLACAGYGHGVAAEARRMRNWGSRDLPVSVWMVSRRAWGL